MSREQIAEKKTYYYIIDGSFRQKVTQEFPDAVYRKATLKDGSTKDKWERHVKALFGRIINVELRETDFGKQIQVTLDENEDGYKPIIQMSVNSREGNDFLRKLPGIDLSKEVKFSPWKKEDKRALYIDQPNIDSVFDESVRDYFYDYETKKALNGMPEAPKPKEEMTTNGWKAYFLTVDDFLMEYLINKIAPQFRSTTNDNEPENVMSEQNIDSDDIASSIPF